MWLSQILDPTRANTWTQRPWISKGLRLVQRTSRIRQLLGSMRDREEVGLVPQQADGHPGGRAAEQEEQSVRDGRVECADSDFR